MFMGYFKEKTAKVPIIFMKLMLKQFHFMSEVEPYQT